MTRGKVIEWASLELAMAIDAPEHLTTIRRYVDMVLDIGINHFSPDMKEVAALDQWGTEIGRFKSWSDAAVKLNVGLGDVANIIAGKRHQTKGYRFIPTNQTLIPKTDKYGIRGIHTEKERAG
jgi:hypothetical protein